MDLKVSTAFTRSENDRGWNNNCNNYGCHGYALAYIPSFVDLTRRNPDGSFPSPDGRSRRRTRSRSRSWPTTTRRRIRFTGGVTLGWNAMERPDQSLRLVLGGGLDVFDQKNDVWSPNELFFEQTRRCPGDVDPRAAGAVCSTTGT